MSAGDLTSLTIKEASRLLRLGSISAAELVKAHVNRIERTDPKVKAYLRLVPEVWQKQADEADRRIRAGDAPPLAGIPVAIKDVLCVRGVETTAGSKILRGFVPPYTATAVPDKTCKASLQCLRTPRQRSAGSSPVIRNC